MKTFFDPAVWKGMQPKRRDDVVTVLTDTGGWDCGCSEQNTGSDTASSMPLFEQPILGKAFRARGMRDVPCLYRQHKKTLPYDAMSRGVMSVRIVDFQPLRKAVWWKRLRHIGVALFPQ